MQNQTIPELNILGFFLSEIGLGQAARNIAYALETTNTKTTFVDIPIPALPSRKMEFSGKCGPYFPNLSNFLVCGLDVALKYIPEIIKNSGGLGKKNYLYPYWELDRIPYEFYEHLVAYDEIFAPSQFIAETFSNFLGKEILTIPTPVYIPPALEINHLRGDKLVIFSLLDFGSGNIRKNPKGVLDAFQLAFPSSITDVELVVKVRGIADGDVHGDSRNLLENYSNNDHRIKVIDKTMDRAQVDALMSSCNVYLSMHRSEGFGFGPAEAMARGKIVIATDYGGTKDFVNQSTGFPIEYKLIPVQEGQFSYAQNQLWADPLLESAASCLREVYEHYDLAIQKATKGREWLIKNNSFPVIGNLLEATLRSRGCI